MGKGWAGLPRSSGTCLGEQMATCNRILQWRISLKHLNITMDLQGLERRVSIPSFPVQKVTWTCAEIELLVLRKFHFQVKSKFQFRTHRTPLPWSRQTKSTAVTSQTEALRGKLLATMSPEAAWSQCRLLLHGPVGIFHCWSFRLWEKTFISTEKVFQHKAFLILYAVWMLQ